MQKRSVFIPATFILCCSIITFVDPLDVFVLLIKLFVETVDCERNHKSRKVVPSRAFLNVSEAFHKVRCENVNADFNALTDCLCFIRLLLNIL
jgi:hypothetical protein